MKNKKRKLYSQRKKRFVKKIFGSLTKPRLSVFKSNSNIYAQLIDDNMGHTLAYSSSLNFIINTILTRDDLCPATAEENREEGIFTLIDIAYLVGQELAEKAKEKNISEVAFDRGYHPYIGRVQFLAEGAREQGLSF